jgi:hypothetical protein
MPFKSRQQQKWAYATKQPFRHRWSRATKKKKGGFKSLPARVKKKGSKRKGKRK